MEVATRSAPESASAEVQKSKLCENNRHQHIPDQEEPGKKLP